MNRQDETAAKSNRKDTLRSIKAKRASRIKSIQERAAEEIRNVNIEYAKDPERLKAKYASDAAYKTERSRKSAARAQSRAEKRIALSVEEQLSKNSTFAEELFNSIILGTGSGISIAVLVMLILRAVSCAPVAIYGRAVTSFTLTGSFLFLTYVLSTLAHALTPYEAKHVFRVLSYNMGFACFSSILSLCALVFIGGMAGWILFAIGWVLGCCAVVFFTMIRRTHFRTALKAVCGAMACTFAAECVLLVPSYPDVSLKLLVTALATYLVGELFHAMKNVKLMNPVFHIFNLMANILVFFSLFLSLPFAM